MTFNVGVIGIGVIGEPIARRLLQAGFPVAVYDIRAEPVALLQTAGAQACASSADVAGRSDVIISLVFDREQTNDVVFGGRGILKTLKPGTVFATGSTLGPQPVRDIAAALAARDCTTLDMPITGGHLAAYEGKLVLMIGGEQATLAKVSPVLSAFAHVITRTGDVGSGQAAKLAHQLVMGMNIMALLEGLSLGVAGGVAPQTMKQIIRDGIADSNVLRIWDDLGPRWKEMLKPAPPGAALPNLRKDLHTALQLAQALDLALPLGLEASRIADAGIAAGHDHPLL